MNQFSLILDAGVILLIVGIFMVSFRLLTAVIEIVTRIWKRMFVSWAARRMRDLGIVKVEEGHSRPELDFKRLVLFVAIQIGRAHV